MQFWNKICGIIAISIIYSCQASAQTNIPAGFKPIFRPQEKSFQLLNNAIKRGDSTAVLKISQPFAVIPMNFYTQHFGVMCQQELAIEKATKIPFRFRLGSVQQCNYLEGKK